MSFLLRTYKLQSLAKIIPSEILPELKWDISKCEIYVECKFVSHSYKSVERITNPLNLVHTYICYMKLIPFSGWKQL